MGTFLSVLPKIASGPAEISAPLKKVFGVNLGTKLHGEEASLFFPYFDIYIHFFLKLMSSRKCLAKFGCDAHSKIKKVPKQGKSSLFVCFLGDVLIWVIDLLSINISFVRLIVKKLSHCTVFVQELVTN